MTDTIFVKNGLIITLNNKREIIENGAVAIKNDKIVAVGNTEDLKKDHSNADVVIDAKNKAIMPGLINLHFHSHFFTRGLFQSETPEKTLDELLCEFFYPLAKKMSPEDVFAEASLAYVDSIKSGTTCVNDIYWRIGALADAANETGCGPAGAQGHGGHQRVGKAHQRLRARAGPPRAGGQDRDGE